MDTGTGLRIYVKGYRFDSRDSGFIENHLDPFYESSSVQVVRLLRKFFKGIGSVPGTAIAFGFDAESTSAEPSPIEHYVASMGNSPLVTVVISNTSNICSEDSLYSIRELFDLADKYPNKTYGVISLGDVLKKVGKLILDLREDVLFRIKDTSNGTRLSLEISGSERKGRLSFTMTVFLP